jgi:hypothetical protein
MEQAGLYRLELPAAEWRKPAKLSRAVPFLIRNRALSVSNTAGLRAFRIRCLNEANSSRRPQKREKEAASYAGSYRLPALIYIDGKNPCPKGASQESPVELSDMCGAKNSHSEILCPFG